MDAENCLLKWVFFKSLFCVLFLFFLRYFYRSNWYQKLSCVGTLVNKTSAHFRGRQFVLSAATTIWFATTVCQLKNCCRACLNFCHDRLLLDDFVGGSAKKNKKNAKKTIWKKRITADAMTNTTIFGIHLKFWRHFEFLKKCFEKYSIL
jgi:hypothetical protein